MSKTPPPTNITNGIQYWPALRNPSRARSAVTSIQVAIVTGLEAACAWMDNHPPLWRLSMFGRSHWMTNLSEALDRRWRTGVWGD